MDDLISVIVPVYNVEAYLCRCLDSICGQTYKSLEIILVDDGSKDRSGEICDRYMEKDSRIRVIHKPNGGVSSARNQALKIATGKYIGFVDADDYVTDVMFETLHQSITQYNADIAICGFYKGRTPDAMQRSTSEDTVTLFDPEQSIREMLKKNSYLGYPFNRLFSRSVLVPENEAPVYFDESIHYAEDMLFNCSCMLKSKKIVYNTTPLYYYVVREGSACQSELTEKRLTMLRAIQVMQEMVSEKYPDLSKNFADYYVSVIAHFIGQASEMSNAVLSKKYIRSLKKEYTAHIFDAGWNVKRMLKYILVIISPKLFQRLKQLN